LGHVGVVDEGLSGLRWVHIYYLFGGALGQRLVADVAHGRLLGDEGQRVPGSGYVDREKSSSRTQFLDHHKDLGSIGIYYQL